MFVLVSDKVFGKRRMITSDIDTLADIIKVAHVAGEMNFGDVFVTNDYAISCIKEI